MKSGFAASALRKAGAPPPSLVRPMTDLLALAAAAMLAYVYTMRPQRR